MTKQQVQSKKIKALEGEDYTQQTEWQYGEPVTVFYPLFTPDYLTKNDLWDSAWLKEECPERFINDRTTSTGKKD